MSAGASIAQKIWASHRVPSPDWDDRALLYVDRCLVHEESNFAFDSLRELNARIRNPGQVFAFTDHYAPTHPLSAAAGDADIRTMLTTLHANALREGLEHFGLDHPLRGIMHVVASEAGLVLPGMVVVGSDSHTSTAGAFGAYAVGIGQTHLKQVFLTQTVWRQEPRRMRIAISGRLTPGTTAKDLIMSLIAKLGANAAAGHVVEFYGPCVASLSMEERMTVCNMATEMGADSAIIAPDDTTFAYLERCENAPKGGLLEQALAHWATLRTDEAAVFERDICFDAAEAAPIVTWGTSLEDATPIDGRVPDPMQDDDPDRRKRRLRALEYMGLESGTALSDIAIDLVFIGSCTNSRIEDLRAAASVVKGRKAVVPSFVSPGSRSVRRQAEAEGLHEIFLSAGFEWRDSGCSMCVGSNGDTVAAGQRCASSSPRNFEGRQGVGARTHVMSPAMAAAAAVTGRLCDVRLLMKQ